MHAPESERDELYVDHIYDMIVVSNRLPVDYQEGPDGETQWKSSPGGLVTALEPVMRAADGAWIGWTGVADREFDPFEHDGISIIPVPLSADELEEYYEGFSNDTLWPLYHDVIAPPSFHREWWDAYVRVNRRFAEAAARAASDGAVVWVQDYQLQLVPRMLRETRPDLVIGFFNHIPFPAYGIYSQLPWRRQVIDGLLGADVIGFQRAADAGNFSRAVRRLFGYTTHGTIIDVPAGNGETRRVVARHFPISIDAAGFEEIARRPDVQARAGRSGRASAIPRRSCSASTGSTTRRASATASRRSASCCATNGSRSRTSHSCRSRARRASASRPTGSCATRSSSPSGRLNGDYSTLGHQAVAYLHHGYPREEMVALYLAADVMLVTALRDGMNLVAKEYVACRFDADGVLLLSEFTGASDELRQAVLVNPHDIEGLKDAIVESIRMPKRERSRRMRALRRRVRENDVAKWSATFLETLTGAGIIAPGVSDPLEAAITRLARTERLLVALDFDGTLAPLVDRPEDARATDRSRAAIERLAAADDTRVAIVSGRALESLGEVASPPDGTLLSGSHGVELQLDPAGVTIDLRDSEVGQARAALVHRRGGRRGCRRRVDRAQARGARPPHAPAEHDRRHGAAAHARDKVEAELLGITVRTGKARARVRRALERQGGVARPAAPARRRHRDDLHRRRRDRRGRVRRARRRRRGREGRPGQVDRDLPRAQPRGRRRAPRAPRRCA